MTIMEDGDPSWPTPTINPQLDALRVVEHHLTMSRSDRRRIGIYLPRKTLEAIREELRTVRQGEDGRWELPKDGRPMGGRGIGIVEV